MLTFRKATPADLDEIFEKVFLAAIDEMDRCGIYQWDEIYPAKDDIAADILTEEGTVGVSNGKIACFFAINQTADAQYASCQWQFPQESAFVIHRLCVSPAFQGQGIASQAVGEIEKQIKALGGKSIRLDAFSQNPAALHLYQKKGFNMIGEIILRKGLFYLMEKEL